MSTPLMFSSFQLLEVMSEFYFYPHIIYFSPEARGWLSRPSRSKNLRPFYISNILVFGLMVNASILQVFQYLSKAQNHRFGIVAMINVFLILTSCISCNLNFYSMSNAPRMVEYINAVVNIEQSFASNQNTRKPILTPKKFLYSLLKSLKIGTV